MLNTQHCRLREMYFLVLDSLLDHQFYLGHHTTTNRGSHSSSNLGRRNNSSTDSGYHFNKICTDHRRLFYSTRSLNLTDSEGSLLASLLAALLVVSHPITVSISSLGPRSVPFHILQSPCLGSQYCRLGRCMVIRHSSSCKYQYVSIPLPLN